MKIDDYGYIVELSTIEAVQIIQSYFDKIPTARGNGKSIYTTNIMTAWNKICKEISEGKV